MRKFLDWSLTSKILTISLVGLLLAIGLCGVGTGFEGNGTPLQNTLGTMGIVLFPLSALGVIIGILCATVSAVRGYN